MTHTPGSSVPKAPGGVIRATTKVTTEGEIIEMGSNFPAYIIYVGPDNEHCLFTSWRTISERGVEGVEAWIAGVKNTYYKGFTLSKHAHQYYQECIDEGVFNALQVILVNKDKSLLYILTRGIAPGVYTSKSQLIRDGLQFHGGTVTVYEGSHAKARCIFDDWKAHGEVELLEKVIGAL
ncbi:hypothetical protein Moror_11216 [Moniliophthora roreri MCA 2997]|uniref:Uncharacterized protein n=1 Tax=Moniliophthora roreri (strain MCA 2997) TaxID=1381753 RepID=V2W766_MONRO|nr:hypothetical protein Moror_11216 [Moniliophthora roreri MCA 2997]